MTEKMIQSISLIKNMTPKEYQLEVKGKLEKIYSEVKTEWTSIKGSKNIYSPRVDLAVGPFAIDRKYESEYTILMKKSYSKRFIKSLIVEHNNNLEVFDLESVDDIFERLTWFNYNARCLLCVEIENKVSRKHLIGGLVNASALGRIGILIPWTEEKLRAFIKLRNYLEFLARVGKNTFKTDNVLILTKKQLDNCLNKL